MVGKDGCHIWYTPTILLSREEKSAYIGSTAFCELGACCKDFNDYRGEGGHWDITDMKKYQIKEDLLHLPFTHTFPRCLRGFTHGCWVF